MAKINTEEDMCKTNYWYFSSFCYLCLPGRDPSHGEGSWAVWAVYPSQKWGNVAYQGMVLQHYFCFKLTITRFMLIIIFLLSSTRRGAATARSWSRFSSSSTSHSLARGTSASAELTARASPTLAESLPSLATPQFCCKWDVSKAAVGKEKCSWLQRLLCSLKGENVYQFEGDRTRDEIVAFAQRLMGPAVRAISSADELIRTVNKREIAFAFIGEPEGRLWVRRATSWLYVQIIHSPGTWFSEHFRACCNCVPTARVLLSSPSIRFRKGAGRIVT